MYQLLAYLRFLWYSRNEHGVHSPFVFSLVKNCFYDKKAYPGYQTIKSYRRELLQNNEKISVQDCGAGSRVFQGDMRKISEMARKTGSSLSRSFLLHRLVNFLKAEQILELGTSLGLGTVALSTPGYGKVVSVEACSNTARFTAEALKRHGQQEVQIINTSFEQALKDLDGEFDLIFLDGHHSKEPTLKYFESLLEKVHNDSLLIIDDIHWSPDMTEAWEAIKARPEVRVSIDTFFWGLVFFRKEQVKEHFVIRL